MSVFENHGIDARYSGPVSVSPTITQYAGTGGNNLPIAVERIKMNEENISLARCQSMSEYTIDGTASTLKARDFKGCAVDVAIEKKPPRKYIVRRLTPTECLRLQGLPDWWVDGANGSDSAIYKMAGNGIAIPCAEDVIGRIAKAVERGW